MTTYTAKGTPEERAALATVEATTGFDIDAFLVEIANTSPIGADGDCIFCHADKHRDGCMWVGLRASLGIGEAQ